MYASSIQILLVFPSEVFRSGLRQAIEAQLPAILVEASNADEARAATADAAPDVALVNAQLLELGAFRLCRELCAAWPELPIILVTSLDQDIVLAEAWRSGAWGLLPTDSCNDRFTEAIKQALAGRRLYTPEQREKIRAWERGVTRGLRSLSDRQWEVLRLIAKGLTNRQISEELVVSPKTAEKHVSAALVKLGVRSRSELMAFLLNHHIEPFMDGFRRDTLK